MVISNELWARAIFFRKWGLYILLKLITYRFNSWQVPLFNSFFLHIFRCLTTVKPQNNLRMFQIQSLHNLLWSVNAKRFNFDYFPVVLITKKCASHFCRETTSENKQFSKTKTRSLTVPLFWALPSLKRGHLKLRIQSITL